MDQVSSAVRPKGSDKSISVSCVRGLGRLEREAEPDLPISKGIGNARC